MKIDRKRKKAFTLAELMVVIAIIAILATVSILGYKSFIKRETINSALTEADQVREVITSQVIASTDGFVQVEYDGGSATTQFTYDGGVLQIATFPPSYVSYANYYIGSGGKERSDCFDAVMRQKFPSLAGVPGLLTIDGSDIWYHKASYDELYEYVTKNGLQDVKFDPSQPFFKNDVAVNIMSMEYKTIDDSGVGDDPTDTPYKLSIDKYEVFVPLGGTEKVNYTVTPFDAAIGWNENNGIFGLAGNKVSEREKSGNAGIGTLTISGVQAGSTYLQLSVGNINRAIKVNVGESGKHIIRAPIQNSSIPWDKESHFPKDTDWIYWGDYTYVIDGKNVKASEIFEIDESTRIPHSELGAYKVKFQFKEAYKSTCCWSTTFKSDPIEVTWKIAKRSLSIPKQSNILEYKPMSQGHISIFNGLGDNIRTLIGNMGITGEIQEPEWSGLVIKDENGADYDLVEHGIVKWSLKRDNDDVYQGIIKFLDDTNKPREHIGYSEPGIYMDAIFEIQPEYTDFYCWMDEQGKALNNPSVTVSWQIHKILIPDPTMPEELKYTAKNPPSTSRNDYFSGNGLEKAKDAGVTIEVYTKEELPDEYKKDYKDKNIIVFKVSDSQLDHYGFRSNEKAGVLIYTYTIEKESIPVPVFTGTKADYTYNNKQKSVRFGREEKHWMLTTYYDYFSDFDLDAETWYDVVEIVDEDSNGNKSVSSAKDAGTYSVIFKIKEPGYYMWNDASSINKAYGTNKEYINVNWAINPKEVTKPTLSGKALQYKSGTKQAPTWKYGSSTNKPDYVTYTVVKGSEDKQKEAAGIYTSVFELTSNYVWEGTTSTTYEAEWRINPSGINIPSQNGSITYDGNVKTASWTGYDTSKMIVTGNTATNAGTHTATFTLTNTNYGWLNADGSIKTNSDGKTFATTVDVSWTIGKKSINVPSQSGSLTYSGSEQTASWTGYDTSKMTVTGNTATNAGTHTARFTLNDSVKDNYKWSTTDNAYVDVDWKITPILVSIPSQSGSIAYDGGSKTASWTGYDTSKMTVTGNTETDAGTHTATFTLKSTNYGWKDASGKAIMNGDDFATSVDVDWKITPTLVFVPSQSGSLTYSGSEQTASWTGYDSSKMSVTGNTETDAGTHKATFTLNNSKGYGWKDASGNAIMNGDNFATSVEVEWTIGKASGLRISLKDNNKDITYLDFDTGSDVSKTIKDNEYKTGTYYTISNDHFSINNNGSSITITHNNNESISYSSRNSSSNTSVTITAHNDNYSNTPTSSFYVKSEYKSCVSGDTLVTLADGSTKRIDELTYDDDVIVWDFFNGEYISCKPFTIFHHQDADSYIKLEFEDGNILKIVGSHKLFDVNTNKWEEIDEINCKDYIGHKFVELENNNNKYVKLVSAEVINEQVTSYSVMTAPHINVVLANMLTFTPQRYDGLYEFFEVGENLTYDQDAMKSDIEKYGLYDSSAFEPYGLSKEAFDYVGGQYFKIFEGRGVITFDQTIGLINDYVFGRDVDDIVPR